MFVSTILWGIIKTPRVFRGCGAIPRCVATRLCVNGDDPLELDEHFLSDIEEDLDIVRSLARASHVAAPPPPRAATATF